MPSPEETAAAVIARALKARGVRRVFGLCGGHVMPIWMQVDAQGIAIVDARDERAAVHMAHAHAQLTGGLGVALVTAGPGLTNAVTGIANAEVAGASVLVLSGRPPGPQEGRGALQDLDGARLVEPLVRSACTVREPAEVPAALDHAVACALGDGNPPGPAYLDLPVDAQRAAVPAAALLAEHVEGRPRAAAVAAPAAVERAAELLLAARRPLVIGGRGAGPGLVDFLDRFGPAYLDTGESRGAVPDDHPSAVGAVRGKAMREADLVVTVGRALDFQLAYGSPAVFESARFLRIGEWPAELRANRRGAVELRGRPAEALAAVVEAAGGRQGALDRDWVAGLRREHAARAARLRETMRTAAPGSDGRMHPLRLVAAIDDALEPGAVVAVDGGDFLSFARIGLSARRTLEPGAFGCLGAGVPFGIAAALAEPERQVLVATGDGAFGLNAMELETAARHRAPVVFVVANNAAWQIEAYDQASGYGREVGSRLGDCDHAAMARALGVHGERVAAPEALPAALERAFAHRPALVDVPVTGEAVSPDARSGLAQVPDLQALATWDAAERRRRGAAD